MKMAAVIIAVTLKLIICTMGERGLLDTTRQKALMVDNNASSCNIITLHFCINQQRERKRQSELLHYFADIQERHITKEGE